MPNIFIVGSLLVFFLDITRVQVVMQREKICSSKDYLINKGRDNINRSSSSFICQSKHWFVLGILALLICQ